MIAGRSCYYQIGWLVSLIIGGVLLLIPPQGVPPGENGKDVRNVAVAFLSTSLVDHLCVRMLKMVCHLVPEGGCLTPEHQVYVVAPQNI